MKRGRGKGKGKGQGSKRGPKGGAGRGGQRPDVRRLAAGIVRGVLERRGAARTHLERAFERRDLGDRDRALLTELVYGTIRHLGSIDALLTRCSKKGLGKVEEQVLAAMRIGAYQLLFLDHVPDAVAVNEAVAAAGRRQHVRGFVNGILRNLKRAIAGRAPACELCDLPSGFPLDCPPSRRLVARDGGWVVLREDLLPGVEPDPAAWLSAAASLPHGLAATWVERYGLEGALVVARAQLAPPPLFLRVNLLRGTREAFLAELEEAGVSAAVSPLRPEGLRVQGGWRDALAAGRATVQDETAMRVAPFLSPRPGERIVDLCAAPGGKSCHLAELMHDEGIIDALDVEPSRVARIEAAVARLGLGSVRPALVDPDDPRPPARADERPIDGVLVDAPCSNTGVLRRRVEARWRLPALDRIPLHALQARLLDRAVELVRPGGRLVYSTCSIDPAENGAQVRALLERSPTLTLEAEEEVLPRLDGGDGGYMARIGRP